jgi:hypothetical protein
VPKVIGGIAALVALAAAILARVDPLTGIWRAGLVFLLGWALTQVWYVFFTVRVETQAPDSAEPPSQQAHRDEAA